MSTVFHGRVWFLSRVVLLDCGLANWSCTSKSVKGGMLVFVVSAVKLLLSDVPEPKD